MTNAHLPIIASYPGPDGSVNLEDLQTGSSTTRRYWNRRIGEFLKELNREERTALAESGTTPQYQSKSKSEHEPLNPRICAYFITITNRNDRL
ncbi:MAG: hypothetical protein NT140_03430 [Deltaproteobacteria bacterium]|nr:hypothetical protein [Deltaproteobacteria bacterium]